MPGSQHAMGHDFRPAAQMAREAQLRPLSRIPRRVHSLTFVLLPRRLPMALEPSCGTAMTGLAADAVRHVVALGAPFESDVVGVAVETLRGPRRIRDPQIAADPLAQVGLEGGEGAGMMIPVA